MLQDVGVVGARRQIGQFEGSDALERPLGTREQGKGLVAVFVAGDAHRHLSVGAPDRHRGVRGVGIGAQYRFGAGVVLLGLRRARPRIDR